MRLARDGADDDQLRADSASRKIWNMVTIMVSLAAILAPGIIVAGHTG